MLVIQAHVWPHGARPDSDYARARGCSEPLVSVIVVNDGTGEAGGFSEGGVGNYDVYEGDPSRAQYTASRAPVGNQCAASGPPSWRHLGRIEGVPRDPAHRAELVRRALELLA